jgi:hypothetical protein
MAPRSRAPDPNPPQGESSHTLQPSEDSQEAQRTDDPALIPSDIGELDMEQLDERIRLARERASFQRKRSYLAAIERGEEPAINPFEFDDPVVPIPVAPVERPYQRPRREGARIQITPLKYTGSSYADLQNFLFELQTRFVNYADDFQLDSERVIYAMSALPKTTKTRWRTYVQSSYQGDIAAVPWLEMTKWLEQDVTDGPTRAFNAVKQLSRMHQREGQTFNNFLDAYEAVESELSYELPAIHRVCCLLNALRPELERQIISSGIPVDRQALVSAARRAEYLIPGRYPNAPSNPAPANSRRPTFASSPGPAVSPAATNPSPQPQRSNPPAVQPSIPTNQQRGSCYKCGDPTHYSNACPQAICGRCGRHGHTESRCPEPLSEANATPRVRHAAPGS